MAEGFVSFLLEQLRSIVVQEVQLIVGVEKEVESLTLTLTMIQAVLKDADEKQVKNEAVKFWLEQLKDVSYDADDVLDEWITRTLLSKLQKHEVNAPINKNVCSILFSLVCCFKPVVLRHEFGVKIIELNKRLDGIAKMKDMYNLTKIRSEKESRLITSSIVDVSDIYGRHADKEVIMSKLFGETSHHDSSVPVISIVGTGGFGKTTLAQQILKEEDVIKYFEKKIWVCVSDPFDHQKVAKQIIEEAMGNIVDSVGWQALHRKLSESVQGKRFILVLDDVWSYNGDIWKQLKASLDCGAVGSRIIITTRDEKTAKRMHSTYIHWLRQLSDDDSWLMFRRIAFWGRENDLEFFEDVAKDVAHKCKGVPISIKVLASVMRLEKNIQGWRNVHASNIWNFQVGEIGFLPSILFSYYALPAELKSCLVYCAILPKDSKIVKKEIVELWMAQGFLGCNRSKDLEIEGGHYFDDLAMRSFFQDFQQDSKGNITSCKMHDLVHDFVQFLSKSETCILNEVDDLKNVNVRHLSTLTFDLPSIWKLKKLRTLRHFLVYVDHQHKNIDLGLLRQLVCLRVLDLSRCDLQELPSDVEILLHLRYLNLSHTKLKELPENICNLLNLQTLKLKWCSKLAKLPKGIIKLCNLRHLAIEGTENLKYLPQGLGRLSCLRTLNKFITSDGEEIDEERCNIRELGPLDHLEGELWISNLGQVANANEATEAKLNRKKNLQSLILYFSESDKERNDDDERILEGLVPHTNLEELNVCWYGATKLPDWISSLSNLMKLYINGLYLHLPALGKLPFLEELVLDGVSSVEWIGEKPYGLSSCCGGGGGEGRASVQQQRQRFVFPRLKILKLYYIDGLKSFLGHEILGILSNVKMGECEPPITTAVVLFPVLTFLEFFMMDKWEEETIPKLKVDSTSTLSITIMPRLSKLEINYCPKLKVIPFYMLAHTLRDLKICRCPQLTKVQTSLPPFLENLYLDGDVGDLLHNNIKNNNYPNLHYINISCSSQSYLPQGFNQLTSIR